ncbi:MAG: hypothetical protein JNK05_29550 [Myxococcales bacterium]|nr:hypothetical protein [Myxococcales bacterium]
MHDWLRGSLEQVPLLHGGVRSVVERCTTPGEAFWLYDLPELVAWVALARACERQVPLVYAQTLASELARVASSEVLGSNPAVAKASALWRSSAAFSALASLGEHADAFEPFDARRVARAQEQIFLALQIGEALQGVHFAPLETAPLATAQCEALRGSFESLVGDWAAKPLDFELQRRRSIAVADQTRRQFGLSRGSVDLEEHEALPLRRWTDVLAVAGVVEAPDLAVEELLPQMESPRDLLLVRFSDLAARDRVGDIGQLALGMHAVLRESLDEAFATAKETVDRVSTGEGLRALAAGGRRFHRAAAANSLRASLAQGDALAGAPLTATRALALVRWAADLGERVETWCDAEQDDRALNRVRNVIRGPIEIRETLRPGEL